MMLITPSRVGLGRQCAAVNSLLMKGSVRDVRAGVIRKAAKTVQIASALKERCVGGGDITRFSPSFGRLLKKKKKKKGMLTE